MKKTVITRLQLRLIDLFGQSIPRNRKICCFWGHCSRIFREHIKYFFLDEFITAQIGKVFSFKSFNQRKWFFMIIKWEKFLAETKNRRCFQNYKYIIWELSSVLLLDSQDDKNKFPSSTDFNYNSAVRDYFGR